jgi:hypothetical protein
MLHVEKLDAVSRELLRGPTLPLPWRKTPLNAEKLPF